ncbi:MAG: YqgE/AlgH family protein [Pirellulaceae bacterium]
MEYLAGKLLIASPYLPDPNFNRTVVLMIQHDEDGALGLVLTRPSEITVAQIWEQVSHETVDDTTPVYLGGPVQGPLMAVHTVPEHGEIEPVPGVYFATDKDHLESIVHDRRQPYRLFLGYSGWGAQQLEAEMEVGGWLTLPAQPKHIFELDCDNLWKMVTGNVGASIIQDSLHLKNMPDDPSLN